MITDKDGVRHLQFGVGRLIYRHDVIEIDDRAEFQLEFRTAPDTWRGKPRVTDNNERFNKSIPGVILSFMSPSSISFLINKLTEMKTEFEEMIAEQNTQQLDFPMGEEGTNDETKKEIEEDTGFH